MLSRFSIVSRRRFLGRVLPLGAWAALSSLTDVPIAVRRALAENALGLRGKKLLFLFLRGGNDALNSVLPVGDDAYGPSIRPTLAIPTDPGLDYSATGPCDFPESGPHRPTFDYGYALRSGNGFAALHPSLKFLAPLYNAGELAILHRVGYPQQSRSHFDSQNYWETGNPNDDFSRDGILYRTLIESGLTQTSPLTGVSFQSSLPLILRGSQAAMTNLSDPGRYSLRGIPNNTAGAAKAEAALRAALEAPFPDKRNRDLLQLQYRNLADTLSIFASLDFSEAGNTFRDAVSTDGDTEPYHLFPTTNAKNGGYALHGNDPSKYVVPTGSSSFFARLKSAAIVLNKTDAIVAGTEFGGFDTHSDQGGVTGSHANLQRRIAWALYALQRYFTRYADRAHWNDVVVVTLSEFGRTTLQNDDAGTDHAEAGVMWVAGGAIRGYGRSDHGSGMFGISPADRANGQSVPWLTGPNGSMFGVKRRYLKRAIDYRSVLGELIRDHLGASPDQLGRILPGYRDPAEHLQSGGISGLDAARILGELNLV